MCETVVAHTFGVDERAAGASALEYNANAFAINTSKVGAEIDAPAAVDSAAVAGPAGASVSAMQVGTDSAVLMQAVRDASEAADIGASMAGEEMGLVKRRLACSTVVNVGPGSARTKDVYVRLGDHPNATEILTGRNADRIIDPRHTTPVGAVLAFTNGSDHDVTVSVEGLGKNMTHETINMLPNTHQIGAMLVPARSTVSEVLFRVPSESARIGTKKITHSAEDLAKFHNQTGNGIATSSRGAASPVFDVMSKIPDVLDEATAAQITALRAEALQHPEGDKRDEVALTPVRLSAPLLAKYNEIEQALIAEHEEETSRLTDLHNVTITARIASGANYFQDPSPYAGSIAHSGTSVIGAPINGVPVTKARMGAVLTLYWLGRPVTDPAAGKQ